MQSFYIFRKTSPMVYKEAPFSINNNLSKNEQSLGLKMRKKLLAIFLIVALTSVGSEHVRERKLNEENDLEEVEETKEVAREENCLEWGAKCKQGGAGFVPCCQPEGGWKLWYKSYTCVCVGRSCPHRPGKDCGTRGCTCGAG